MQELKNGLLVINKPTNFTSRDIVNIVSKELKTKKVGHTGTLDPLASGVLILCLNRYTKLVDIITNETKEYIAEIKLGIMTDTLDITGNILKKQDFKVTKEEIIEVFKSFIGTYRMEVPLYSAIKINGKKLYEYARNNESVELPVKDVQIYNLELLDYQNDIIKFKVIVEKGTYIRSLIRDIAKKLNTLGTMNSLIRTKQGNFTLDMAYNLEDIKDNNYKLLTIRDTLKFREYELSFEEYNLVKNGNPLNLILKEDYVLLLYQDREIAIYKKNNNLYKCEVMLEIN